jgi:hypothetical protein
VIWGSALEQHSLIDVRKNGVNYLRYDPGHRTVSS